MMDGRKNTKLYIYMSHLKLESTVVTVQTVCHRIRSFIYGFL